MSSATPISTPNNQQSPTQTPTLKKKLKPQKTTPTSKKLPNQKKLPTQGSTKTKKKKTPPPTKTPPTTTPPTTTPSTTTPSTTTPPTTTPNTTKENKTPLESDTSQSPAPESVTLQSPQQPPAPDQDPSTENGSPQSIEQNAKQTLFVPSCVVSATLCGPPTVRKDVNHFPTKIKSMDKMGCISNQTSFTCNVPTVFSTPSYLNLVPQSSILSKLKLNTNTNTNENINIINDLNMDLKKFWKLSLERSDLKYWIYEFRQILKTIYTKYINYLTEPVDGDKPHNLLNINELEFELELTGGNLAGIADRVSENARNLESFTRKKINVSNRKSRFSGYNSLDKDYKTLEVYQTNLISFIDHVAKFIEIIPSDDDATKNTLSANSMILKTIGDIETKLKEITIPTESTKDSYTMSYLVPELKPKKHTLTGNDNKSKLEQLAKIHNDSDLKVRTQILEPIELCRKNIITDLQLAYSAIFLLSGKELDTILTTNPLFNFGTKLNKIKKDFDTNIHNIKIKIATNKKNKSPTKDIQLIIDPIDIRNTDMGERKPAITLTLLQLLTNLKTEYTDIMNNFNKLYKPSLEKYIEQLNALKKQVDKCVKFAGQMTTVIKNLLNTYKNDIDREENLKKLDSWKASPTPPASPTSKTPPPPPPSPDSDFKLTHRNLERTITNYRVFSDNKYTALFSKLRNNHIPISCGENMRSIFIRNAKDAVFSGIFNVAASAGVNILARGGNGIKRTRRRNAKLNTNFSKRRFTLRR